jgi:hypothetical protein
MADRFKLEDDIVNLHNVADDLDMLAGAALEDENLSRDDIANALIGLGVMLRLRADKAFDTFKAAFHLDEYSPEKQKYTRQY